MRVHLLTTLENFDLIILRNPREALLLSAFAGFCLISSIYWSPFLGTVCRLRLLKQNPNQTYPSAWKHFKSFVLAACLFAASCAAFWFLVSELGIVPDESLVSLASGDISYGSVTQFCLLLGLFQFLDHLIFPKGLAGYLFDQSLKQGK